jgi:hypothetical protein
MLEGGVAEAVVSGALQIVLQDFIGLAYLLETDFGGGIAMIAVGMMLLGGLAIGALDDVDGGRAFHAQNFVVTPFCHRIRQPPETADPHPL